MLSKAVHRQSMTFGSRSFNGTPDYYYDGYEGELWVEWKQIAAWPRDGLVGGVDNKKRGCYSTLQYDWMVRRWARGKNVVGMIGLPDKTVVIQREPREWKDKTNVTRAVTRKEACEWIANYCLGA